MVSDIRQALTDEKSSIILVATIQGELSTMSLVHDLLDGVQRFNEHRHLLVKRGIPCRWWHELSYSEQDAWIYPERYQ